MAHRGHLLAMPLICINMGAEMTFILEQRLKAQNVPTDKARRVLTDVVRTMFSAKFLAELFKPQEVYTNRATRAIFDRLAHSSIMRLNKNSMDKLYDLMTMGFKYQMTRCLAPAHLMQVTLNHLEALKRIVDNAAVNDSIDAAIRTVVEIYGSMPVGELWALKQTLCRFFQDRRVKVSLFLQDGLQNLDGTLVIDVTGPLPIGTDVPGGVRYFEPPAGASTTAGGAGEASKGAAAPRTERLSALVIDGVTLANEGSPFYAATRACKLGDNLYAKDRRSKAGGSVAASLGLGPEAAAGIAGGRVDDLGEDPVSVGSTGPSAASVASPAGASGASAASTSAAAHAYTPSHGRAAMELLSSLMGMASPGASGAASDGKDDDPAATFPLALFGEDGALASAAGGASAGAGAGSHGGGGTDIITFDAEDRTQLTGLMRRLGFEEEGGGAAGRGGESKEGGGGAALTGDDLLAIMDSA